jgi:hypothetical protein
MVSFLYSSLALFNLDSGWAQFYVSFAPAVLTFLTLIILCIYAYDTHQIARSTVEQYRDSQTPFLALIKVRQENMPRGNQLDTIMPRFSTLWAIENQGNATAINIQVSAKIFLDDVDKKSDFSANYNPIAVGCHEIIKVSQAESFLSCDLRYESLDGRRFKTSIFREGNELKVTLLKL